MKIKNVKIGNLLYLKAYDEVQESKYFNEVDSDGDVWFTDGSLFYSGNDDGVKGGTLVEVTEISGDDIVYKGGVVVGVSRHAFRKPTKKELEEYRGGVNHED